MIITLAFKKNYNNDYLDILVAKCIQLKTKSKYFHVEAIIKDNWMSSNGLDGVKLKPVLPLSNKYDYYKIKVDGRKLKKVKKFIQNQNGKKYDYLGILLSQFIKIDIEDRDKWFCSEFIATILILFGINLNLEPHEYAPGDLYTELNNKNLLINT